MGRVRLPAIKITERCTRGVGSSNLQFSEWTLAASEASDGGLETGLSGIRCLLVRQRETLCETLD
jgi:hypothetical protein